jgi:hypothetical protein
MNILVKFQPDIRIPIPVGELNRYAQNWDKG